MSLRFSAVHAGRVEIGSAVHAAEPHQDPTEEYFDVPQIIFTLQDRWDIRGRRGSLTATPDMLVLGDAGEPYVCRHDDRMPKDRTLSLHYTDLAGSTDLPAPLFPVQGVPVSHAQSVYLTEVQWELQARRPGFRMKVEGLAYALLGDVLRSLHDRRWRSLQAPGGRSRHTMLRVDTVRDFIDAHFTDDLDLSTLAAAGGLSPFHFSRLFKQRMQMTPHQYVMQRRLEYAAQQLSHTDFSVTEIALAIGFQDSRHFARIFRRHSGQTPTAYRRNSIAGTA